MTRAVPTDAAGALHAAGVHAPVRPIRRIGALLGAHTLIDTYSAFVPPILGVLEVRCDLTEAQTAWLLGIGSLSSGLSQPFAAWLSDRFDSRVFGAIGLLLAAVCLSSIGRADSFATLVPLFALGMIGVGIFHPIGASSTGQASGSKRSLGVSFFFVAGMIGGIIGASLSPRLTALDDGFTLLQYMMVPGVLGAVLLHLVIRGLPHRVSHEHAREAMPTDADVRGRWAMIALLYAVNATRFTVNIALVYLFVRWAQAPFALTNPEWRQSAVAEAAAPIVGNLTALSIVGMMVGGLTAGALVRQGREKLPMILVPVILAPSILVFPIATVPAGYALAVASGIAFASMVPVTLSLAQRLLPHRTSLASGLMLGGAWAVAVTGPRIAEWAINTHGLDVAFYIAGIALAMSGLMCVLMRQSILSRVAGT